MNPISDRSARAFVAPLCIAAAFSLFTGPARAQTTLNDVPLFSSSLAPSNVLLALSVEFPTAISRSNNVAYSESSTPSGSFVGYFDPYKCYQYHLDPNDVTSGIKNSQNGANNYFVPVGPTDSTHGCNGYWSGNFLNWATLPTIDPFRWALSGGNRSIDTSTLTVLEKGWNNDEWGLGAQLYPGPYIANNATLVGRATPFSGWSSVYVRIYNFGVGMRVADASSYPAYLNNSDTSPVYRPYLTSADLSTLHVYDMQVRAKVCDPTVGLESNCTQYGSGIYKPTGLIQKYANTLRFAAISYVNDNNNSGSNTASDDNRNGGVLRAQMNSVGPTVPVPGGTPTTNPVTEWDPATGIFYSNPDPSDASSSGLTGDPYAHSGLINYLNKFGSTTHSYKGFDPVGELLYAGLRYLKNQSTIPLYTTLNSNTTIATNQQDHFPIIRNPADPVQYSCQKNFILGLGDTATNADGSLPGSINHPQGYNATTNSYFTRSIPPEIASDSTVNVATRTSQVGVLEGINVPNQYDLSLAIEGASTFYFAGLAYDAHTHDMRPNDFLVNGKKQFTTTATMFWLDVMQFGTYYPKSVYYLGAKYGGFTVPTGFNPDTATPSSITQSMWNTTGALAPDGTLLPDNLFLTGNAQALATSLNTAFAKINALSAAGSAFSIATPKVQTSGSASYSTAYDASSWTGSLIASSVTFSTSTGATTLTQAWEARDKLQTQAAGTGWNTGRIIATSNAVAAAQGVPFRTSGTNKITNTAYLNALGSTATLQANMLNFLRGDASNTGSDGTASYRTRAYVLGDIVDSRALAVGAPSASYSEGSNPGYTAFTSANASRPTMVYVGANDGMMHAFNGALTGSGAGNEAFAYVPSMLFQGPSSPSTPAVDGLQALSNPNYVHRFYVDITPAVVDVDFGSTAGATGGPDWHSLLVGGLGKGGKGYYAIDVTAPQSITTEPALAGKVLWEFTDSRMGFSYGQPTIVKTKQYGWVVIVTSGYNNADGKGYFFILNPKTGALLQAISTGVGSPTQSAGMTDSSAYVASYADFVADSVYAADLLGNVWRLDLTPATGNYLAPTKIAALADSSGNSQPVTTRPLIETDPNSLKRYVFIGTGQLLADSDILNNKVQTFYSITDGTNTAFDTQLTLPQGVIYPIKRANLNALTISTGTSNNLSTGLGSNPASPSGYYVDLPVSADNIAERVNQQPTANNGVVLFAGNLPDGDACTPSGTNQVFALSYATGQSRLLAPNSNGVLQVTPSLSGGNGLVTDLQFVNVNGTIQAKAGTNQRLVTDLQGNFTSAGVVKKLNWREVPLAD